MGKKEDLIIRAKSEFAVFLLLMWKHLGLPPPTRAQYAFAEYLQNGPRLRVLMAFRGVGKSWVTAAYVIWQLWVDPQRKVLVLSATSDRAIAFSTFTKRVISEWPLVQHLQARPGQRDSVENFDVGPARASQSASIKSLGVQATFTGSRCHIAILDDVEVPKNSETVTQREKLANLTKEISAVLIPENDLTEGEHTTVTVLGTPQTEDTLYARYPERGYSLRIWPARYPTEEQQEEYTAFGAELFSEIKDDIASGNCKPGEPTDPRRFDDADLLKREREYGRTGWALQFQLNPSVSDADRYPLKIKDIVVMDLDSDLAPAKVVWSGSPEHTIEHLPSVGMAGDHWQSRMVVHDANGNEPGGWQPYTSTVMAIDPSGRGRDETSAAVVSFLNGYVFLRELVAFRGDGYSDKVLSALAHIAAKYPGRAFQIESNMGDGMFTRLWSPYLLKIAGGGLLKDQSKYEVRHSTQKEKRIIDSLGPVLAQHRLVVDTNVVRHDFRDVVSSEPDGALRRCFYQMTRITLDRGSLKFDDRLDALSMAVRFYTQRMDADADSNIKQNHMRMLKEEAESMYANIRNLSPAPPTVPGKFGI